MKSSHTRSTGTFRFAVRSITLSGYDYAPDKNIETMDFATI